MQKLLEILEGIRPDVDFVNEMNLIDGGFLDSFDVASIIAELNEEYDITIRVTELKPDNFNSAEAILKMVDRLRNNKHND
ncbi:MAG: acyl carrier protein [Bacteroidales bacterium]|nr:acyl carrier protein [Bacteroidales bacterium]